MFNVTCENQRRADERIPILLDLPFNHKGIMCAPYIGPVSIREYYVLILPLFTIRYHISYKKKSKLL